MKDLEKIIDKINESSPFPWWEWDIKKGSFKFNSGRDILLHFDLEKFLNLYYLNSTRNSLKELKKLLNNDVKIYQKFFQVKEPTGEDKWYLDLGVVAKKNKKGKPEVLKGFIIELEKFFESPFVERDEIFILCSYCKRMKVLDLKWIKVPEKVLESIKNKISHSLCPICLKKFYS